MDVLRELADNYPGDELAIKSRYKMAEILHRIGRYVDAISEVTIFIEKYPVNEKIFDAYYLLGDSRYRTGDFSGAVSDLTRALQLGGDRPWKSFAMYEIALSYGKMSQIDESEEWLEKLAKTMLPLKCAVPLGWVLPQYVTRMGDAREPSKCIKMLLRIFQKINGQMTRITG